MGAKMEINNEVKAWIEELCGAAGEKEEFVGQFLKKLEQSPFIYKELLYFAYHQNFLCEYKVNGYSVVDILVWQMDHFKSRLDRDNFEIKHNQNKMIVAAFDTFMDMEREPQKFVDLLQSETGTDYPEKY